MPNCDLQSSLTIVMEDKLKVTWTGGTRNRQNFGSKFSYKVNAFKIKEMGEQY
jgi:hypothetical protein